MADRLVWVDLEMTGLDPAKDVILEIAALVTTGDLEPIGDGIDLVVSQPKDALDAMVDVVREMHASSGLTEAVLASTTTLADAEAAVLAHVREHVPNTKQAPLCGNSIGTDRGFLARYMPDLDGALHYRMVDVSSIKELCRRWYPRIYQEAPEKAGGHRALADIRESVDELRYYRSTIFIPPPPRTLTSEGDAPVSEPAPSTPNPTADETPRP